MNKRQFFSLIDDVSIKVNVNLCSYEKLQIDMNLSDIVMKFVSHHFIFFKINQILLFMILLKESFISVQYIQTDYQ